MWVFKKTRTSCVSLVVFGVLGCGGDQTSSVSPISTTGGIASSGGIIAAPAISNNSTTTAGSKGTTGASSGINIPAIFPTYPGNSTSGSGSSGNVTGTTATGTSTVDCTSSQIVEGVYVDNSLNSGQNTAGTWGFFRRNGEFYLLQGSQGLSMMEAAYHGWFSVTKNVLSTNSIAYQTWNGTPNYDVTMTGLVCNSGGQVINGTITLKGENPKAFSLKYAASQYTTPGSSAAKIIGTYSSANVFGPRGELTFNNTVVDANKPISGGITGDLEANCTMTGMWWTEDTAYNVYRVYLSFANLATATTDAATKCARDGETYYGVAILNYNGSNKNGIRVLTTYSYAGTAKTLYYVGTPI